MSDETTKPSAFAKFEELARRLLHVSKSEVAEKEGERRTAKDGKKAS